MLARVRAVAPNGVANWFTEEGPATIVVMRDGYERAPEIRSQLRAAWKPGALEPASSFSIGRTVAVAGFLAIAAVIAVAVAPLPRNAAGGRGDRGRRGGPWPGCRGSARSKRAAVGERSSPSWCRCRSSCFRV